MEDFTPITTSKGKFLAVKVPEWSYSVRIIGLAIFFENKHKNRVHVEPLPPGSYTLLFCTKEVTEQQAGEVVPIMRNNSGNSHYDYFFRKEWLFNLTRLESLRTLLLAHGLNPEDNWAVLLINK